MPVLTSSYRSPWWLANGHVQTLLQMGRQLRRPPRTEHREVLLPDGDFVDVEIARPASSGATRKVVVVTHGLEGSSRSVQARAMAAHLCRGGWEVWSWSFRSCSGRHNRRPVIYHSACTDDLHAVVEAARVEAEAGGGRHHLALVGYSLGGNLTLRYLGEQGAEVAAHLLGAVTYSVPVDLNAAVTWIDRPDVVSTLYRESFLRSLRARVRWRRPFLPDSLPYDDLDRFQTFVQFDDAITAPLHGFTDARSYYALASSKPLLGKICVPTLLVTAADDPLLPPASYPWAEAEASEHLYLEVPTHGGHCAFFPTWPGHPFWIEKRTAEFLAGLGNTG